MRSRVVALALALALAAGLVTPAALLAAEDGQPAAVGTDAPEAPGPAATGAPAPEPGGSGDPAAPTEPPPSEPGSGDGSAAPAAAEPAGQPADARQGERPDGDKPLAFAAAPGSVTIKDFSFGPASITVGVGETVTWRNAGPSEHTATANDGSFDTGLLARGESASHRFTEAGSFSYFCEPHPFMKGTVRVVASGSGSGSGESGGDPSGSSDSAGASGSGDGSPSGASSGPGLAATGAEAGALLALGLAFLAAGLVLRRRARHAP